jgi:ATP-dependent Lon protease
MATTDRNQVPSIPQHLPVLPLRNMVLFTGVPTQLLVGRAGSLQLIQDAWEGDRLIAITAQKEGEEEAPQPKDLYEVGVVGLIHRVYKLPENHLQILVRGVKRARLVEYTETSPYLQARVEILEEVELGTQEEQALAQNLSQQFQKMVILVPTLDNELQVTAINLERQPAQLADFIASGLDLPIAEKQALLEELSARKRQEALTVLLNRELSILEMGHKIQNQVQEEVGQVQREHYLREQMRVIQQELGEDGAGELEELRQRIGKAKLPEEVDKEVQREFGRLTHIPSSAAEYTVVRTYLDWILDLPWRKSSRDRLDIGKARQVLEEDHEGLDKIKERILEHLAVCKLKKDSKGPIFCFVGPPGVGKTSLGRSIARAMGRKFARISLGGVHDEAEIRGHRRTYIGALPGRIIQSLHKVGTNNPVLMLDEIDKVGADFRGDPAAALLEVLDPEQNSSFVDHYLDVPFDLSKVMFIATANQLETIPPALLDRMEIIQLSGYTEDEKVRIARTHLLPRQLREHGLQRRKVKMEDEAIRALIRNYTQEAGLRNLEREVGRICRKIARQVVEGGKGGFAISHEDLAQYLGAERVQMTRRENIGSPGVVAGLAWTPVGGEVMFVEATKMKGSKGLTLTGKLGEVMKESAQIALSYVRTRVDEWGIDHNFFDKQDIHIHLPSGAVPKDGPSAGVTVATSLLSILTGRPVREDVAMTGEVTLRGRVLPVGGIKEKVLAAHRAGMSTVILPRRNSNDLDELPDVVRQQLHFVLVEDLAEVFEASLAEKSVRRAA